MTKSHLTVRLAAGVFGLLASAAWSAPTSFWVPLQDGTTFNFLETGRWSDSNGQSGVVGPSLFQARFSAIDRQIFDHRATLKEEVGGAFLMETSSGYFIVSDGDPADNQWYEYYIDPSPFSIKDPIEVGASLSFQGRWRGQWFIPGGGTQSWTGQWTEKLTHLGSETVTTPLGTFDAFKLGSEETSMKRADAGNTGRSTWNEVRWIDPAFGFVKISGSGISESDFDGDGTADYWLQEEFTWEAAPVPEPASWALLAAGGLLLVGAARISRRSGSKH